MLWPWLVATVACIVASGFYSGCETGVYCVNAVRLELRRRRADRRALTLSRMLADREGIITTTLVGTNVANYLATVCVVSALTVAVHVPEYEVEIVTTLVLTPIIFIFGEVTPKNLFRREADYLMYRLIWPLRISDLVFRATGVIALLKALARLAARCVGFGRDRTLASLGPRQRIAAMLREGVGVGILTDEQSAIVDRVMNLSRVRVRSAMIDRRRVCAVPVDATWGQFIELAETHNYSRMPVLAGPDKMVGLVNIFDVLSDEVPPGEPLRPITDFMTPPLFLQADQSVTSALTAMQRRGTALAGVIDEQGRFLGIVTVKDLVEEIVGDLQAW